MRKGILIAGLIVAVLGALLVLLGVAGETQSLTVPAPSVGTETFTPQILGSGTATLSWSGADSSYRFSIYECSPCRGAPSGAPLANGAGASGSVSFSVSGGQQYEIYVSSTSYPNAVPITLSLSAVTPLMIAGIVVVVVGAVVAVLGVRMKAKPKPKYAEAPKPKEMFSTKPFSGVDSTGTSAYEPAAPVKVEPRYESEDAPKPVYFEQTDHSGEAAPSTASGSARPPVKCSYCGTLNEAWVTNCRKCRRPLAKTG